MSRYLSVLCAVLVLAIVSFAQTVPLYMTNGLNEPAILEATSCIPPRPAPLMVNTP